MKTIPIFLLVLFSVLAASAQPAAPSQVPGARSRILAQRATNGPMTQPLFPQAPPAAPAATSPDSVPATPGAAQGFTPMTPPANVAANVGTPSVEAKAPAEPTFLKAGDINWQGVDLNIVLTLYAQYVGRTLIRGTLPEAKIILKTETPLTRSEVIQAIQAVLALNGISVVEIGDKFVKVVPSDQANQVGGPIDRSGSTNLPNMGSYVTHVVQLKYVKPTIMGPLIAPFSKLQNSIFPIDDNGILILRDYAENVKRMLEMIAEIDVSVPAVYVSEVIPIRYQKVEEIASALSSLGGGGGSTVSIGSSSSGGQISGLANRSGGGFGGGLGGGMGGMGGLGGGGFGNNNMQANGGLGGGLGNRGNMMGGNAANPNGTPSTGSSFAQRLNNIINRAGSATGGGGASGSDQIQLFGQTKIIPNASSSTLLIYATRADMDAITNIIAKLDVPLPQVLLEAVIMDVTLGHDFKLGVSVAQNPKTLYNPNNSSNILNTVAGAGGMNNGASFLNFLTSAIGTNSTSSSSFANSLGGGFSYFGNIGPTWDAALTAAQSDDHASIIQRPRIQASQAKPAQFFVGETRPYVTSSYGGGGYGGFGNSYSQLSVGVELDVTPFINPEGLVVMDIQQEIDDFAGTTHIDNVGDIPNTVKRTINSEIAVRDRDTVMLGGFIKSDKEHKQSGVPYLMNIPVLGNLFKSRADSKNRKELIVLIRPTVLQTPKIAADNTIKEKQRLPGISAAAAEDAEYERSLVDAEKKREQKRFKQTKQYDGFFNPEPDVTETNRPVAEPVAEPAPVVPVKH